MQEAVSIAIGEPEKAVVFFAVGFETTRIKTRDGDLEDHFTPFGTDLNGNPVSNSGYGTILIVQSGKDKKTRRCATETDTVICKHAYDAAYGGELRFHFSETIVLLGKHVFDIEEGAVRFISWTIIAKTLSRSGCRADGSW